MLKYVVILLDKSSVAFCHADNPNREHELIPLQTLRDAIRWSMLENLNIQFVYPDYQLPQEYLDVIDTIDHVDIKHSADADVCVIDGLEKIPAELGKECAVVLRTKLAELFNNADKLIVLADKVAHLSVVIKDIHKLSEEDAKRYQELLSKLNSELKKRYVENKPVQINLLTDRLVLDKMNNCNAGWETITLAPDGNFYICPAFYYDGGTPVGNLKDGLDIKNPQLYYLQYAPICRTCDAYQCRRCVWLNKQTTLEVNTPSHEQCVASHLERNASRDLLLAVRKHGIFMPDTEIKEIDYLDPFDNIKR